MTSALIKSNSNKWSYSLETAKSTSVTQVAPYVCLTPACVKAGQSVREPETVYLRAITARVKASDLDFVAKSLFEFNKSWRALMQSVETERWSVFTPSPTVVKVMSTFPYGVLKRN